MHLALLLVVSLQIEPNPPIHGEGATLTIETRGETAPLRVDIGQAAMLQRVPDGATMQRNASGLELHWPVAPQRATCELVLRAEYDANWLNVTARAGTSEATLGVKPVWRPVERPARFGLLILLVLAGLALSLLLWPTIRLLRRHNTAVATIAAIFGTGFSVVFVLVWWNDYASTRDYRKSTCLVTDRMLVDRGLDRKRRLYSPMFAVQLDGHPRIAGDSDSIGYRFVEDQAPAELAKFDVGKVYPCWYSVRDRHEVLLEPRQRGIITTALVTVGVLLLMALPGWVWKLRS
ncbi:MAG TPA: hypothetical protein VNI54_00895 [Thermoanaerobaculia bacterium]|nr:hypothetical protein [Thermoanaerobaculia bacterium]